MAILICSIYMLLGLGTALLTLGREMNKRDRIVPFIVWMLIWPVVWLQITVIYLRGHDSEKCAWCGETVGPYMNLKSAVYSEADDRIRTLWRNHYLYNCKLHPLYSQVDYHKRRADTILKQSRGTELLLFYLMAQKMGVRLTGDNIMVPASIDDQCVNTLWFLGWVRQTPLAGFYEMTDKTRRELEQ